MLSLFAAYIVDTSGKFATGINNTSETGGKFAADVVDTGGEFATGVVDTSVNFGACVVDTGGKFATGVVDTGGPTRIVNISTNFRKNLKWS